MAIKASIKMMITLGLIHLDFGHGKFGIITIYGNAFKLVDLYSGFGLSIVAGLLYSLCFTFMQLMELCTDSEHKSVKGIIYHHLFLKFDINSCSH